MQLIFDHELLMTAQNCAIQPDTVGGEVGGAYSRVGAYFKFQPEWWGGGGGHFIIKGGVH